MSSEIFSTIKKHKIISIIRSEFSVYEELKRKIPIAHQAGLRMIEITLNTPDALKTISWNVSNKLEGLKFGAGTVTTVEEARAAIDVGAQFLVCPILSTAVIELGQKYHVPVIPGCLTPTEVFAAHAAGAEVIKLFPATTFGPAYVKDILAPLTELKLIAVGGVDLDNAKKYLLAGAIGIGVGNALLSGTLIKEGADDDIFERIRRFLEVIK